MIPNGELKFGGRNEKDSLSKTRFCSTAHRCSGELCGDTLLFPTRVRFRRARADQHTEQTLVVPAELSAASTRRGIKACFGEAVSFRPPNFAFPFGITLYLRCIDNSHATTQCPSVFEEENSNQICKEFIDICVNVGFSKA